MSSSSEIPPEILESVKQTLGAKYEHGPMKRVKLLKGQEMEDKILALTECRTYILPCVTKTKVEHRFNHLHIDTIESEKPTKLKIELMKEREKDKPVIFSLVLNSPTDTMDIIEFILKSLQRVFPMTSYTKLFPKLQILPQERKSFLDARLHRMSIVEQGPCGGFSQMYKFMCDYFDQPYLAEVAWDVDTIYLSQDNKELRINDFDDQEPRHMLPIISVLCYNTWFTKLTVVNCKLTADVLKEIPRVLQLSEKLESLTLDGVGLRADFIQELSTGLLANSQSNLRMINLSNNNIHDAGIKHLCGPIANMTHGLVELRLAKTGMTAEGASHLGKALAENNFITTTLKTLDLSGNAFKDAQHGREVHNLYNFLCLPNNIAHLNLSDSDCSLNNLFECLFRGCVLNIVSLNLSGTFIHSRLHSVAPRQVKSFFSSTKSLKCLNISRNKMPPAVVREILESIGFNKDLTDVEVDLSSNELGADGSSAISCSIPMLNNITTLNLHDNGFNTALVALVAWVSQNNSIQTLDLGQNMGGVNKRVDREKIVTALEDMITTLDLPLHTLSLANNKMRTETQQLINALGSNTTLTSVDLSGNAMGDIGARLLAKALQINSKLQVVKLDSNGIGVQGFQDLANALEKNYTLKQMPIPVMDMSASMKSHPEKTEGAVQKIQEYLQRNHSPRKFSNKQAFLLQRGFLYTTAHQMVDKLVVHIEDMANELTQKSDEAVQDLITRAKELIDDANNSKKIFDVLDKVVGNSEDDDDLNEKLRDISRLVEQEMEERLQNNANGMVDRSSNLCSYVMQNRVLYDKIEDTCQLHYKLPQRFVEDLVEHISAETSNQCSEANLAMASFISDSILDEIIEQLSNVESELSNELKKFRDDVASGKTEREVDSMLLDDSVEEDEERAPDEEEEEGGETDSTPLRNGSMDDSHKSGESQGSSSSSLATTPPVMSKKQTARVQRCRSMKRPVSHFQPVDIKNLDEEDHGSLPPNDNLKDTPKIQASLKSSVTELDAPRPSQSSSPSGSSSPSRTSALSATPKSKPKLIELKATKGESATKINVESFDLISREATTLPSDIQKSKPRISRVMAPKNVRPSRPVPSMVAPLKEDGEVEEEEVSSGIEGMFKPTDLGVFADDHDSTPTSSPSGSQASLEDSGPKRGIFSRFKKKDKKKDKGKEILAKKEHEAKVKREKEEKAKKEHEAKVKKEREEKAKKEKEEKAKKEKEKKEKEEKLRKEKEEKVRKEKEEKAKKEESKKKKHSSATSYKSEPAIDELDRSSKISTQTLDSQPDLAKDLQKDIIEENEDQTDGPTSPITTVAPDGVEGDAEGEKEEKKEDEEEEEKKEEEPVASALKVPKAALRPMTGVGMFSSDVMAQLKNRQHSPQEQKVTNPKPALRPPHKPTAAAPATEKAPPHNGGNPATVLPSSPSKDPTSPFKSPSKPSKSPTSPIPPTTTPIPSSRSPTLATKTSTIAIQKTPTSPMSPTTPKTPTSPTTPSSPTTPTAPTTPTSPTKSPTLPSEKLTLQSPAPKSPTAAPRPISSGRPLSTSRPSPAARPVPSPRTSAAAEVTVAASSPSAAPQMENAAAGEEEKKEADPVASAAKVDSPAKEKRWSVSKEKVGSDASATVAKEPEDGKKQTQDMEVTGSGAEVDSHKKENHQPDASGTERKIEEKEKIEEEQGEKKENGKQKDAARKVQESKPSEETSGHAEPVQVNGVNTPKATDVKEDAAKVEQHVPDEDSQRTEHKAGDSQPKTADSTPEKKPAAVANDVTEKKKESPAVTAPAAKTSLKTSVPPPSTPNSTPPSQDARPSPKPKPRPPSMKPALPKPALGEQNITNFRSSLKPVTIKKPEVKNKPKTDGETDNKPRRPSDYKKQTKPPEVNGDAPASEDVFV